jgi:hypothetical protein
MAIYIYIRWILTTMAIYVYIRWILTTMAIYISVGSSPVISEEAVNMEEQSTDLLEATTFVPNGDASKMLLAIQQALRQSSTRERIEVGI